MSYTAKLILEMVAFAIVILLIYNALKHFFFDKIKVNKWIILAIAIIVLIVPSFFGVNEKSIVWQYGPSGIFILLFLWFIDLNGWNKKSSKSSGSYNNKNNKKDIKIKPKAKPNRVKNKKD